MTNTTAARNFATRQASKWNEKSIKLGCGDWSRNGNVLPGLRLSRDGFYYRLGVAWANFEDALMDIEDKAYEESF